MFSAAKKRTMLGLKRVNELQIHVWSKMNSGKCFDVDKKSEAAGLLHAEQKLNRDR